MIPAEGGGTADASLQRDWGDERWKEEWNGGVRQEFTSVPRAAQRSPAAFFFSRI